MSTESGNKYKLKIASLPKGVTYDDTCKHCIANKQTDDKYLCTKLPYDCVTTRGGYWVKG